MVERGTEGLLDGTEGPTLREAHDIGESLQMKIEALELTERCFVHLDYEWNHAPEH